MDINARLKQIEALDEYLSEKNKVLLDSIDNVGWSDESLLDEMKVQCPINSEHWVHESALSKHIELCSWVKQGYLKEDMEKQPPCSDGFYQHISSIISLTIDKETQRKILIEKGLMDNNSLDETPDLPKTIDRWTVELTPEQRLAIYDYVVQEGKSCNKPKNLTLEDLMFDFEKKSDQDQKPKTGIEILAEQRDYKRRRQSYRAKNVHITNKSYTEVMKEVIENQTIYLAETRKPENERPEEPYNSDTTTKETEESDLNKDKNSVHHRYSKRKREASLEHEDNDYHRHKKTEMSVDRKDYDYHRHSRKNKGFDQEDSDDSQSSRRHRSESPKSKKRKHKHKRSRSRSRSRHHKSSHKHKHKKSRDS